MQILVYGIPTCGTVKKALKWLEARRVPYEWVDLRRSPPDAERLTRWIEALGAKALRNTSGGAYRALGDEKKIWDDTQWCVAYAADAMLLKRPIVEIDGAPALVGFTEADWVRRLAS